MTDATADQPHAALAAHQLYVATRRTGTVATPEQRRSTMHTNPDYLHSVDPRANHLKVFLSKVPDGIKAAAQKVNLTLNQTDVDWLTSQAGFFQVFIPQDSRRLKEIVHRNKNKNKNKPAGAFIGELQAQYHVSLGKSPRFKDKSIAANTVAQYEQSLASFWNFLSLIGDYQSMIILLPNAPKQQLCEEKLLSQLCGCCCSDGDYFS